MNQNQVDNKDIPEEALIASEAAKPSSDPAHWAKKSCKQCYGRGIYGTSITGGMRNELTCQCATKKFLAWRSEWIQNYLVNKK